MLWMPDSLNILFVATKNLYIYLHIKNRETED